MQYLRSKFSVVSLLVLLGLLSGGVCRAGLSGDEQKLLSHIRSQDMMATIERLCSKEFRGRKAGSLEECAAADYIISKFAKDGLSATGADGFVGYKQALTMNYGLVRTKDDIKASLAYKVHGKGEQTRSFLYRDYNGRGGLDIKSDVVFVGYGISDPSTGHDDYKGLDVTGKVVIWLSGQPKGVSSKSASGSYKALVAYQHGAAACLVYRPSNAKDEWGTNVGLAGSIADFPYIAIDDTFASELLSPISPSARSLMSKASDKLPIGAHCLPVELKINPVCDPDRKTFNLIGEIPGSDPLLSKEIVLVGAHYDHLGDTPDGQMFAGADDNASGTSVVLEIAHALKESGLAPKRTIVFASWTGEECGLVGSNYFTVHPPFPLSSLAACVNLDMVGEGNTGEFMTTGKAAYPDRYKTIDGSAEDLGYKATADQIRGASDHLAFGRKKVPSFLIYTAGEHPNYHSVRDVPSAINPTVLESAARLTALSVWRLAQ